MNKKIRGKEAFRFKRFLRKSYAAFKSMGKQVSIGVLTSCMLFFAEKDHVMAQDSTQQPGIESKTLEEVEVTASRVPIQLAQAAKIVTVISRSDIDAAPVESIQDLLEYAVGVDVRQRSEYGVQSDISIRGGTNDQIAVLLNGTNVSNPQTGHYSFDIPVNISDIQRIEIIEGPATKTYGSGAFVGAVNIITDIHPKNSVYAEIGAGMHELVKAEVSGSLHSQDFSHQLSAGYSSSGGYISNSDFDILNLFWQSHYISSDADIFLQAGYNDKSYGANTFYSAEYPDQHDHTQRIFGAIKAETKGKIKFTPQLFWHKHFDHYELIIDNPKYDNYHQTEVFGGKFDARFDWSLGKTVFGGEIVNENILSTVLGKPTDSIKVPGKPDIYYTKKDNRTNISYFLEHNVSWEKWNLSVGILAGHNTALNNGFRFYPGVDISYQLSKPIKLFASVNKALRMPTFTDLYYEGKTNIGNPDLEPEEATAYEIGIRYVQPGITAYASGYFRQGKNLIDWVKINSDDIWESKNLTELNTYGIETSVILSPRNFIDSKFFIRQIHIGYAYISQNKDSYEYISKYALEYLKHKFLFSVNHDICKNINMQWNFRWQDRTGGYTKYEDLKPAYEVGYTPYGIVSVKINWSGKQWNIHLNADNIFNTEYYDLGNIPQPGFWLSGGIKYRFN